MPKKLTLAERAAAIVQERLRRARWTDVLSPAQVKEVEQLRAEYRSGRLSHLSKTAMFEAVCESFQLNPPPSRRTFEQWLKEKA